MSKISIIVPVFNVENYVCKCIDSILDQTFSDFELILVDDGSTDKSGKICDDYLKKDNRIRVFHKKNGGLSSARNFGIDHSSCDLIGFIDSDDYIENDMFQILYNDINFFDADIAICQIYNEKSGNKIAKKSQMKRCVVDNLSALRLTLEMNDFTVNAVNKLYRKKLFENVHFPEGKIYEDAFTIPILMFNSRRVSYNPLPKYVYVHRENSITKSSFSQKDFCIIEAYEHVFSFVKKNAPSLSNLAYQRCLYAYASVFDKMTMGNNFKDQKEFHKISNLLKSNFYKIMTSNCFSLKKKVKILALKINFVFYKFLMKIFYGKV